LSWQLSGQILLVLRRSNMALLQSGTQEVRLVCRCLVGRSALADFRLRSRRASSEHASIGWYSDRWVLRDLGSSNGTTVDGRPVAARDRVTLAAGSEIAFGGDEVWTVVDLGRPQPCASLLGPQTYVWGTPTLLVLPSVEEPEASVLPDGDQWLLDDGNGLTRPECGDIVRLKSGHWRLFLPEISASRNDLTARHELDLAHAELTFRVSRERIALRVDQGANQVQIPSRACLYTLLALARLRMGAESGRSDGGWISSAELAEARACMPEKVNVDIHRVRKLLEDAGVHNTASLIERDDAKRLRIGVTKLREIND
jgi:hypothetical protein